MFCIPNIWLPQLYLTIRIRCIAITENSPIKRRVSKRFSIIPETCATAPPIRNLYICIFCSIPLVCCDERAFALLVSDDKCVVFPRKPTSVCWDFPSMKWLTFVSAVNSALRPRKRDRRLIYYDYATRAAARKFPAERVRVRTAMRTP